MAKKPTNTVSQFNRLDEAGNNNHTEFLGSILGVKSCFIAEYTVSYDVGKLKDEDMDLINGPLPLAPSKKGPDMCHLLKDLDCTAPVTRLKQAEPEYLSLIANHCDTEVPGIVETIERETDIPLPIDCFYQLAKHGVDEAGNIKWE